MVWNHGILCPKQIGKFIIPTDELTPSFFRGGRSTTNQNIIIIIIINNIITIYIYILTIWLTVYYQPMVARSTTNQSWGFRKMETSAVLFHIVQTSLGESWLDVAVRNSPKLFVGFKMCQICLISACFNHIGDDDSQWAACCSRGGSTTKQIWTSHLVTFKKYTIFPLKSHCMMIYVLSP